MGTNCNIYLPDDVQYDDVMDVVGILIGLPVEKHLFDDNQGYYYRVTGVEHNFKVPDGKGWPIKMISPFDKKEVVVYPQATQPSKFYIEIKNNPFDNIHHSGLFYMEHIDESKGKLLSGGCNEFWQRIGFELIKFFGGSIDFDDCDSIDRDFVFKKPRKSNYPRKDKEWQEFQDAKANLKPIF